MGKYDVVLANINRNILLNDLPTLANSMADNGTLIISGFYKEDESVKGIIEVYKKGEVLTDYQDGQFIYEERGLFESSFSCCINIHLIFLPLL